MLKRFLPKLRGALKSSRLLYPLFLRIRGSDVTFPGPDTLLHITGFPRSATTSTLYVMKQFLPEERLTSHIHSIADLKLAKKYQVPTIVLCRNPADAVASQVVKIRTETSGQSPLFDMWERMTGEAYLEIFVRYYIKYYRYVESNADSFVVSLFENAVSEIGTVLEEIERAGHFRFENKKQRIQDGRREYKKWKEKEDAPDEVTGLPNKKKEEAKKNVKENILRHPRYTEAEKLFTRLSKCAV